MGNDRSWVTRYNRQDIDIFESSGAHIFVATSSVRRVLPKLYSDEALKKTYGRAVAPVTKNGPLFFNETALRREVQRLGSAEAQMFGDWLHHNIFYPAAKKRGDAIRPERFGGDGASQQVARRSAPLFRLADERRVNIAQWLLTPFTAHWRGEVTLRKTLIENAIAACLMVWLVERVLAYIWNPDHYHGNWWVLNASTLMLYAALGGVWIWWGVGVMRNALNPATKKKSTAVAFTVYMFGLLFMIESGVSALGDGHDIARALFQSREVADIQFDASTGRIALKGEIGFGTYRRLLRVLDEQPKAELLEVDSPGGYVIEGFALARLVKQRGLNTVAFHYCDSACTLIFAAGKQRYLGPKVSMGFHRSYVYGKPILDVWSATEHRMSRFLRERGVEMDFIELAFYYGGDDLWLPKQRQMLDAKYATARWVDPK